MIHPNFFSSQFFSIFISDAKFYSRSTPDLLFPFNNSAKLSTTIPMLFLRDLSQLPIRRVADDPEPFWIQATDATAATAVHC